MGLGIGGGDRVYLDLTHLDRAFVTGRLGAILDIYRKFAGRTRSTEPMKIFPAAHYAMGGLWVDFEKDPESGGMKAGSPRNHATNIPGLYACGECDYGYHGANRLGANSLLSASYSGGVAGESVAAYLKGLGRAAQSAPAERPSMPRCAGRRPSMPDSWPPRGRQNPYALHRELGELMTTKVGVVRDNRELDAADQALQELAGPLRAHGPGRIQHLGQPDPRLCPPGEGHDRPRPGHRPQRPRRGTSAAGPTTSRSSSCRCRRASARATRNSTPISSAGRPTTTAGSRPPSPHHSPDGPEHPLRRRGHLRPAPGATAGLPVNAMPDQRHRRHHPLQDPPPGQARSAPYWEEFEIPYRAEPQRGLGPDGSSATTRSPSTASGCDPVTWEHNCMEEVCGACAMLINGRARPGLLHPGGRADPAHRPRAADQVPGGARPAGRPLADVRRASSGSRPGSRSTAPGTCTSGAPRISPQDWAANYLFSRCMTCGCCMEACPQYGPDTAFIGPAAARPGAPA